MANKKIWLGMLVMVLAFGMTVVGCAAMAAYEAASLARQAEAGGSTTARSAGGGRIDYTNTSSSDTYLLWDSVTNRIVSVPPRYKGYLAVYQDREIIFRFRIQRAGERQADWQNENTSFWPNKSFYVSGGETFTLEIP